MDDMPPMIDAKPVTEHLNTHLGKIEEAWAITEDPAASPFWLVRYERVPEYDWVIVGTYGLSRLPLYQENGLPIRQELLACCPKDQVSMELLSHLEGLASAMVENEEALGLGETIFMTDPIVPNGTDEKWAAWFITIPFFVADHGYICEEGLDAPLVLTWAVPVYESEMLFIAEKGNDAFNNVLLAKHDELFSFPRPKLAHSIYSE